MSRRRLLLTFRRLTTVHIIGQQLTHQVCYRCIAIIVSSSIIVIITVIVIIIRVHHSTTYIDAACCYKQADNMSVSRYVCLLVGLSVTIVSHAKMAEPIEMPFGVWTQVGLENHVLDRGPNLQWEGAILRGEGVAYCKV